MATFLSLCADVASNSGAAGRAPVSVVGQDGRTAKVVNWVRDAWIEVQNMRDDWTFLQGEWSGTLTPGTAVYTDDSFNIERWAKWKGDTRESRPTTIYDPAIGVSEERPLRQIPYDTWRRMYAVGLHDHTRPVHYAFAPNGSICFGPTPDKFYEVRGEYGKAPQVLAKNDDVPDLPARFHRVIVWLAISYMHSHDESPQLMQMTRQLHATPILNQMRRDLLPEVTVDFASPLA